MPGRQSHRERQFTSSEVKSLDQESGWGTEKGLPRQALLSHPHVRSVVPHPFSFLIFLDPCEDLRLGPLVAREGQERSKSLSPAGSYTDGHCGGDAENLAPWHAV